MKEIVLITGESGSLAKLVKQKLSNKYQVKTLTRNKKKVDNKSIFYWNISEKYINESAINNCTHIIHLAGYPIINKWSKKNKQLMFESRIEGAKLLFSKCQEFNIKPKTFISASAIGYYGLESTGHKTEKSEKGNDWVAELVDSWEHSADNFKKLNCRVIKMRISLLISKETAFLKYNILSVKFGIGLILGDKNRKISWIHIDDAAKFIQNAIQKNNYSGTYNLATENNITEIDLIKILRKKYCSCALIINMPFIITKLLIGERSKIINTNYTVSIDKLKQNNFQWIYEKFDNIL